MKKLTRAAIAAAAGTALLLGTGSTLAYWNANVSAGSASITAGQLKVTQTGTPAWNLIHNGITTAGVTPANLKLVPGDQLV